MSHDVYQVHTWTCSIPDCKESLTGYGESTAIDQGWAEEVFYQVRFDLCPFHNKEMKGFLFDEPPVDSQL